MNYLESAKSLAQSTKRKSVTATAPDRGGAAADQELERLEVEWREKVKSGSAILRMEVCRRHALRLQDFESWFTLNVSNQDRFKHSEHFFSFPNGDMAVLVTVDDAIAASNIESVLGAQAEKYESLRDRHRLGQQQKFADVGDPVWQEWCEEW